MVEKLHYNNNVKNNYFVKRYIKLKVALMLSSRFVYIYIPNQSKTIWVVVKSLVKENTKPTINV